MITWYNLEERRLDDAAESAQMQVKVDEITLGKRRLARVMTA